MKRLYEIRKELGKTQREFAEALKVSHTYISDIEAGRKTPSHLFLLAIEYIYGVNAEWLKGGKGDKYTHFKALQDDEEALIKTLRENPQFKSIVLEIKKLIHSQ